MNLFIVYSGCFWKFCSWFSDRIKDIRLQEQLNNELDLLLKKAKDFKQTLNINTNTDKITENTLASKKQREMEKHLQEIFHLYYSRIY